MRHIYTADEAKSIGDACVVTINETNVITVKDGSRFKEVASNIWRKDGQGHEDNLLYVSASHHDGGVVVRPLYLYCDEAWRNIFTGKEVSIDEPK